MAPSGPCGSERPDNTSTSFEMPTLSPCCHAISKPDRGRAASKLARRLLRRVRSKAQTTVLGTAPSGHPDGGRSRRQREGPYGEGDTDHQQQELLVLVAAWLAADEILRARFRGDRHRAGRRVGARRNPAAVVLDPGAVPAARRRRDLGYAGDRRISQRRGDAGRRASCRTTASSARIAARSAAKSIPASPPLRASLPVNLKGHFPGFKIWSRAQADIDRSLVHLARLPGRNPAARSCSASGAPWRTPCTRRW